MIRTRICISGLSPRGRGKRALIPNNFAAQRSIPAWAGETEQIAIRPLVSEVYPRVGGGNRTSRRISSRK